MTTHNRYEISCTYSNGESDILGHWASKADAFFKAVEYHNDDRFKDCAIGIFDIMAHHGNAEKWMINQQGEIIPVRWRGKQ